MSQSATQWTLTVLICFLTGFAIALLTLVALTAKDVSHLPGGSLGAGLLLSSALIRRFHLRPAPLAIVVCAVAGVLGWVALLPFIA